MLKQIDGFPDYAVTDKGSVVNTRTGRFLQASRNTCGYPQVEITNDEGEPKTHRVHRLVAIAFVPNPDGRPEVNHKDGDKTNNAATNLEWVTRSQNVKHAFDTGLKRAKGLHGERNVNAKLTWEKVREIRSKKGLKSQQAIADEYGVAQTVISDILRGTAWKEIINKEGESDE